MSLSSTTALMDTADRVREFQREADAALVEAAGCRCAALDFDDEEQPIWTDDETVERHHKACPIALAAKIRGGA
jgi:hypothetical protein